MLHSPVPDNATYTIRSRSVGEWPPQTWDQARLTGSGRSGSSLRSLDPLAARSHPTFSVFGLRRLGSVLRLGAGGASFPGPKSPLWTGYDLRSPSPRLPRWRCVTVSIRSTPPFPSCYHNVHYLRL